MSPFTEGTVVAVVFICTIRVSFYLGSFGSAVDRDDVYRNPGRHRRIVRVHDQINDYIFGMAEKTRVATITEEKCIIHRKLNEMHMNSYT